MADGVMLSLSLSPPDADEVGAVLLVCEVESVVLLVGTVDALSCRLGCVLSGRLLLLLLLLSSRWSTTTDGGGAAMTIGALEELLFWICRAGRPSVPVSCTGCCLRSTGMEAVAEVAVGLLPVKSP